MSDAIPVNRIKGVGEKTAALFGRINVFTVEDLIGHYPRDYETYDAPVPIREASAGSVQAIYGQITAIPNVKKVRNLSILNAVLTDDNGDSIQLTIFNLPFLPYMKVQRNRKLKTVAIFVGAIFDCMKKSG